ncbi:hypothetical protein GCM10027048_29760 [Hymenobacter coalescens]
MQTLLSLSKGNMAVVALFSLVLLAVLVGCFLLMQYPQRQLNAATPALPTEPAAAE